MRIIKPGKTYHVVYPGTCHSCGCVFEAEPGEVLKYAHDPLNRCDLFTCDCPTLGCTARPVNMRRVVRDGPPSAG